MMSRRLWQAFGMGLFFIFASLVSAGTKEDLSQAKAFLKEHLQEINRKYPFTEWEDRLKSARAILESMRNRQAISGPGFDMAAQARMAELGREAADLSRLRSENGKLMQELRAASLADGVEAKYLRSGTPWN